MLRSSSDTELVAAWRALSGLATGDGWKLIELFSIGNCRVMAGRRGARNEESVLVGVRGNVPSQPFQLPRGQGFSLISTELQGYPADHSWFALVRQESGSLELFTKVAADLVNLMESTSVQDGLRIHSAMISRIRAWQAFMKRDSDGVLSKEEEIGLFGELLVLQNLLDDGVSEFDALDSWAGPDDGLHDFLLGDGAIEVKTTLAPAGFIARVSNLDQLDDSLHQPLFVAAVRLAQLPEGATLPEVIDQVAGQIRDPGASALLNSRLVSAGYMDMTRAEYTRRFRFSELTYRIVCVDSPRLTRSSVPAAIHEARYSLDLDAFPIAASTYADISTSLGVKNQWN